MVFSELGRPFEGREDLGDNMPMRIVGSYIQPKITSLPSAQALREAASHQAAGQALQVVSSTGHMRGIYRFKSHEEMNQHDDQALTRAIVQNLRARQAR